MLAINLSTLMTTPLEEGLRAASDAGFPGVELRIPHLEAYLSGRTLRDLLELVERTGVKVLSINAIERFNTEDEREFADLLDQVRRWAKVADGLGCPFLICVPQPETAAWDEVKSRTVRRLAQVARVMRPFRVRPLLEFIGFSAFPLCTLGRAAEVAEGVAAETGERVGLVVDTFHHALSGTADVPLTPDMVRRVALVHLDDVEDVPQGVARTDEHRVLPGYGVGRLPEVVRALQAGGYAGAYSVELFRPEYWRMPPADVARRAYEAARRVVHGP